jgi:serine/threonine protein kinase
MARSFRGDETEANTTRVVGTYGYMAPEYAVDGLFSVKSDVFSFGVLVLEIVSGKRNRGFYHREHYLNLLGHAWQLHNEGRSIELMNEFLRDSCNVFEVLRAIHVALLCVQRFPEDRPSMSNVVLMLSSEGELPQPKQPGFFTERNTFETNSSLYDSASVNELTSTVIVPR